MPISRAAYEVGSVLVLGGETAHTLANSTACHDLAQEKHEPYLREALAELAALGLITWSLETDYGAVPPRMPAEYTEACFRQQWLDCFGRNLVDWGKVPGPNEPTIFIDPTETLARALGEFER